MEKLLRRTTVMAVLFSLFLAQAGCFPHPENEDGEDGGTPVSVNLDVPEDTFTVEPVRNRLAHSWGHTLWIQENGSLWSSGFNSSGQLGDGATQDRSVFKEIDASPDWVEVSTGVYHSAALRADGSVWTWGGNMVGQLGDNTFLERHTPEKIGSKSFRCSNVSSGYYHVLAIRRDGTLWQWGSHPISSTPVNRPVRINMDRNWAQVSAGEYHSVALKKNGSLWAWGRSTSGQLGTGSTVEEMVPVEIMAGTTWLHVSAGKESTIGVQSDGTLWVWGELSTGIAPYPVQVGTENDWAEVAAGSGTFCAIKLNGSLWAWGDNSLGQLGLQTAYYSHVDTPTEVNPGQTWNSMACGESTTLAFQENDTVSGWGDNSYGQTGQ